MTNAALAIISMGSFFAAMVNLRPEKNGWMYLFISTVFALLLVGL